MNKFAFVLTLVGFGIVMQATALRAAEVTCYNDDSLDVINQDEMRLPPYPFPPAGNPRPDDCVDSPSVAFDTNDTLSPRVLVDGKVVYDNGRDPIVEARVAPSGAVALLTSRGSLLRYREGTTEMWFTSGVRSVREFRMARDGQLIAAADDGALIVKGRARNTIRTVSKLYAAASGRVVALLSDGTVVDANGSLYAQTTDPARELKVSANGKVVLRTESGRLVSASGVIYDTTVDPVVSFRVNASGTVAYATAEGRLWRDKTRLDLGVVRVESYRINSDGSVTGTDSEGRAIYFR